MVKINYTTIKIIGILCLAIGAPLSFYYSKDSSSAPNLHMHNQVHTSQVQATYYIQASPPQKDRHKYQYSLAASENSTVAWFTQLSLQQTIVLAVGTLIICFILYSILKNGNTFSGTEHTEQLGNDNQTYGNANTDNELYTEDESQQNTDNSYNGYDNITNDTGNFNQASDTYNIGQAQSIGLTSGGNGNTLVEQRTNDQQHDINTYNQYSDHKEDPIDSGNTTDVEHDIEQERTQNRSPYTQLQFKADKKKIKETAQQKKKAFQLTLELCKQMVKGEAPGKKSINDNHIKIFAQLVQQQFIGLTDDALKEWNNFSQNTRALKFDMQHRYQYYNDFGNILFNGNPLVKLAKMFPYATTVQFKNVNYNGTGNRIGKYTSQLGRTFVKNLSTWLKEVDNTTKIQTVRIKTQDLNITQPNQETSKGKKASKKKKKGRTQIINLEDLFANWDAETEPYKKKNGTKITLTKRGSWQAIQSQTLNELTSSSAYDTDNTNITTTATETDSEHTNQFNLISTKKLTKKEKQHASAVLERMIQGKPLNKNQQVEDKDIQILDQMLRDAEILQDFRNKQKSITFDMTQVYNDYSAFTERLFESSNQLNSTDQLDSFESNNPVERKNVLKVGSLILAFPNVERIICNNMAPLNVNQAFIKKLQENLNQVPNISQLNEIRISTSDENSLTNNVDAIKDGLNNLGWFVKAEGKTNTIVLMRASHRNFEQGLMPKIKKMIQAEKSKLKQEDIALGKQLWDATLGNPNLKTGGTWDNIRYTTAIQFDIQYMYTQYPDFMALLFVTDDQKQPEYNLQSVKNGLRLANILTLFPNTTEIRCNNIDCIGTNQKNKPTYSAEVVDQAFIKDLQSQLDQDPHTQLKAIYIKTAKNNIQPYDSDDNKWKIYAKKSKNNRKITFTNVDLDTNYVTTDTEYESEPDFFANNDNLNDINGLTDDDNKLLISASDGDDTLEMTKKQRKDQAKNLNTEQKNLLAVLNPMLTGQPLPSNSKKVTSNNIKVFNSLAKNKGLLKNLRENQKIITIDMQHMHKYYAPFMEQLFVLGDDQRESVLRFNTLTTRFLNVHTIDCNNIGWTENQAINADNDSNITSLINKDFLDELLIQIEHNSSETLTGIRLNVAKGAKIAVDLTKFEGKCNELGWVISEGEDKILLMKFSHKYLNNSLINKIKPMIAGKSLDKKNQLTASDSAIAKQLFKQSLTDAKNPLSKKWTQWRNKPQKITINMQYMHADYKLLTPALVSIDPHEVVKKNPKNVLRCEEIVNIFPNVKTIICKNTDNVDGNNTYTGKILNKHFLKELRAGLAKMDKQAKLEQIVIKTSKNTTINETFSSLPYEFQDEQEKPFAKLGWTITRKDDHEVTFTKEYQHALGALKSMLKKNKKPTFNSADITNYQQLVKASIASSSDVEESQDVPANALKDFKNFCNKKQKIKIDIEHMYTYHPLIASELFSNKVKNLLLFNTIAMTFPNVKQIICENTNYIADNNSKNNDQPEDNPTTGIVNDEFIKGLRACLEQTLNHQKLNQIIIRNASNIGNINLLEEEFNELGWKIEIHKKKKTYQITLTKSSNKNAAKFNNNKSDNQKGAAEQKDNEFVSDNDPLTDNPEYDTDYATDREIDNDEYTSESQPKKGPGMYNTAYQQNTDAENTEADSTDSDLVV